MCTLEYVTDFLKQQTFIDHMTQVMQLEDKAAFVKDMDEQTVLQYLLGMLTYANFELSLGAEMVEILFAPLKVTNMKQFAITLTKHARTFL